MSNTNISKSDFSSIRGEIEKLNTDRVLIIADHNVWSKYSKLLNLEDISNKETIIYKAPDGEKAKNLQEYESCVEFLLEKGVHRKTHVLAVGGGALSDFAGFVASTLLRGLDWSVIPTTLLSMVDASIGGKVALNSKEAKNLIGAFHKPKNIWIIEGFLETLAEEEQSSGLGEVSKYCFLDKEIFELVQDKNHQISDVIEACANFKYNLTEKDFKESGLRKNLNLGHSFGHAIEKIYNLPHGIAVFWGMALIFKLYCNGNYLKELSLVREKLELDANDSPWHNREFPIMKIMNLISKDKKMVTSTSLELVLIEDIGMPTIKITSLDEIEELLEEKKDELRQFSI